MKAFNKWWKKGWTWSRKHGSWEAFNKLSKERWMWHRNKGIWWNFQWGKEKIYQTWEIGWVGDINQSTWEALGELERRVEHNIKLKVKVVEKLSTSNKEKVNMSSKSK